MADKDVLADAREQFKLAEDASSENRQMALDDIKFARMGEQWPEDIKTQREREGRPCLTINRLPAFGRRVVNEARQNKPAIQVLPANDASDVQTANILTGLVRNIEATSDADVAYDTGIDAAVFGGFGYWRVDVDYACDDAFDLDLAIRRINNPFTVYADHRSTAADSSDWTYCFVTELLSTEEFERTYKGAEKSSWEAGDDDNWFSEDNIRLAEWWQREKVAGKLVQLVDGTVMRAEQFEEHREFFLMGGLTVKGERETMTYKVSQQLITGAEVLDTKEWHGRYIPVIPVYGDEVNVEGKRHFRSLIRDARDPQKMLNFWRTAGTELVALAPKVPFIGPRGAFGTDAEKWANVNRTSYAYLEYDGPVPPQRQPLDTGAAAGALQEAMNASEDMKAIMGIYDPALGQRSNEVSGLAIRRRQKESDVSTFHFQDNLNRAVRHTGRVLLDLIPTIYSGPRIVRILGEDMKPQNVKIGPQQQPVPGMPPPMQPMQPGSPMPPQQPGMPVQGMEKVYDVTVGKYDVIVKAGPAYGTRREEAAEQQIAFMQAVPAMAPLMTDILAENLDWPQSDKLKQRIEQQMANPPPNPEMLKAQAQAQLKQLEAQSTQQIEQIKAQAEVEKARALAQVDLEKSRQQSLIDQQTKAADNATKAAIEREKIASQENMKAAEITATRQNKLLELAAGILSAREGRRGANLTNSGTLDQSGAGVEDTGDINSVAASIAGMADVAASGGQIVSPQPPAPKAKPRRPRKAKFAKQGDGTWLAEELE